jgi:hypothetical protein
MLVIAHFCTLYCLKIKCYFLLELMNSAYSMINQFYDQLKFGKLFDGTVLTNTNLYDGTPKKGRKVAKGGRRGLSSLLH